MVVPGYVPLAGSPDSVRTADQASLDITGDHEAILCVALDDWTPGTIAAIYAKWQSDSAAGLAYAFRIHSAGGIVNPVWWDTGTGAMRELFGSATGRTDGEHLWIRVLFDADNGSGVRARVYTSTDPVETDPGSVSWTQLNSLTNATAAAISSNNQPLWLGLRSNTNDNMVGKYFYFQLRTGTVNNATGVLESPTTVAVMDARTTDPTGADGHGNSWSLNSTAWVAPEGGEQQDLTGILLNVTPTFGTGAVTSTRALAGSLLGVTPTFPTGEITPGEVSLAGALLEVAPSFPTGAITALYDLAGSLLAVGVTFGGGVVNAGDANLAGELLAVAVTFPQGGVTQDQDLTGSVLVVGATFPQGAVTPGEVALAGALLEVAIAFGVGRLFRPVTHLAGDGYARVTIPASATAAANPQPGDAVLHNSPGTVQQ